MYDPEPYGIDDEYISTADLNEVIQQERMDADRLQAQYEAESNEYWRLEREAQRLLDEGKIAEAVAACPHGGGCGLTGSCAKDDPRYGEEGMRCGHCGAVVTGCHGDVIHIR